MSSSRQQQRPSRQAIAQAQQRAHTRARLADFRRRTAAEVEACKQRAAAAVERQLALALGALPAAPPPLGQGHAAASQAYQAYLAKHEAAEQRRRQAEALAAERHAAAVAAKQQALDFIRQQEADRLQRYKAASALEARRARAAATAFARCQDAAAQREQQRAAAAAAAEASRPRPLHVSTHIDYRFTRIHDLGPAAALAPPALVAPAPAAAAAAAAGRGLAGPAFAVEARAHGKARNESVARGAMTGAGSPATVALELGGSKGAGCSRPLSIISYDDYLQQLQMQCSRQRR